VCERGERGCVRGEAERGAGGEGESACVRGEAEGSESVCESGGRERSRRRGRESV